MGNVTRRMVTLVFTVLYIFSVTQVWKIWDCFPLSDDTYVVESDPSIQCFSTGKWWVFASLALVLLFLYTVYPYLLYRQIKLMDRSSESAQKGFGHLYTRFKTEIWYWG